jgi:hypothetical protein
MREYELEALFQNGLPGLEVHLRRLNMLMEHLCPEFYARMVQ